MNSKPLVIIGSARKESDTRKFVDRIFHARDHTLIDLLDVQINGFDYTHSYPAPDAYPAIVEEMLGHEVIVFATPVYWYAMSALMKTFFDRFSDLITYRKTTGRQLKGKSTLLIAVGADQYLPDGYEIPFKSTSEYLDMNYLGYVYHCTKNELPDLQQIQDFIRKLNGNN